MPSFNSSAIPQARMLGDDLVLAQSVSTGTIEFLPVEEMRCTTYRYPGYTENRAINFWRISGNAREYYNAFWPTPLPGWFDSITVDGLGGDYTLPMFLTPWLSTSAGRDAFLATAVKNIPAFMSFYQTNMKFVQTAFQVKKWTYLDQIDIRMFLALHSKASESESGDHVESKGGAVRFTRPVFIGSDPLHPEAGYQGAMRNYFAQLQEEATKTATGSLQPFFRLLSLHAAFGVSLYDVQDHQRYPSLPSPDPMYFYLRPFDWETGEQYGTEASSREDRAFSQSIFTSVIPPEGDVVTQKYVMYADSMPTKTPFLGYSVNDNLAYINAIERVFNAACAARVLNELSSIVTGSAQSDKALVRNAFDYWVNQHRNIDDLINGTTRITLTNEEKQTAFSFMACIPEKIPYVGPAVAYASNGFYYPRQRLATIYADAMSIPFDFLYRKLGVQDSNLNEILPDYSGSTPDTDASWIVDNEATRGQPFVHYIHKVTGEKMVSTIPTHLLTDAYTTSNDLLRYPTTGGMSFSSADLGNFGVKGETALEKFLPLAVGAAIIGLIAARRKR